MDRKTFLQACRDFPHRWRKDIRGRIRVDYPEYGPCCPLTAIANQEKHRAGEGRHLKFTIVQPGDAGRYIGLRESTLQAVRWAADAIPVLPGSKAMRRDLLRACRLEAD